MEMTETGIFEFVKQGLMVSAEKPALWFYGRSITYRELFGCIDNVADHLYAMGVREGTVVTIHLPNCPQAVMAIYAVAKLGGVCNLVHPLLPAKAVQKNMVFSESEVLITSVRTNIQEYGFSKRMIQVDLSYFMGAFTKLLFRAKNSLENSKTAVAFESLLEAFGSNAVVPQQNKLSSQCAVYMHSTGTTGTPKTVMLDHRALNRWIESTRAYYRGEALNDQVCLGVLPLFHGLGFLMDMHRTLSNGGQLVMMARWDVNTAIEEIKRRRVTVLVGVPTMYFDLLKCPQFSGKGIRQLRECFVGGDCVPLQLIHDVDARVGGGRHMYVAYGLTEAATANCVTSREHDCLESCGYPLEGTEAAVLNEHGELNRVGQGELMISNGSLMMGYLKDPDASQAAFLSAEGRKWVHTGDYGRIDEDGYVYFIGRMKNIIVRKGINVFPGEIEEVINRLDFVSAVCVIGKENKETKTQMVCAVVVLKQGMDPQTAKKTILRECLAALPKYSVPEEILFADQLPRNLMGKVDRDALANENEKRNT